MFKERETDNYELETLSDLGLKKIASGKVRELYQTPKDDLLIVTTDRLSAFDRVLTQIPGRGEILNRLSEWWFNNTSDIVPNHMVAVPDPNVMIVRKYPTVPIEMVVRGYLTGSTDTSIWRRYSEKGDRIIGGITLPEGMNKNEALPHPIVDPTTKATSGHDTKLTEEEIISSNLVSPLTWQALKSTALALFARGQELSKRAGLLLVDTKYEFGIDPQTGSIVVIDEIHTPDSSRFWGSDTYEQRIGRGETPEIYDKEFARLWYASEGYLGGEDTPIPQMPPSIIEEVLARYLVPFERLTGTSIDKRNNTRNNIRENVRKYIISQT